jgi:hypothetical protein
MSETGSSQRRLLWVVMGLLVLGFVLGFCTVVAADGFFSDLSSAGGMDGLSARVVTGAREPLRVGRYAEGAKVLLRNEGWAAIVLRGVRWESYPEDGRQWLKRLPGSTTPAERGTVTYHPLAQQLTSLAFETGLILPGEMLSVALPLTPQKEGRQRVVVSYKVIGGSDRWTEELLLPQRDSLQSPRLAAVDYSPATPDRARGRRTGEPALVRSTSQEDAPRWPLRQATLTVWLPVAKEGSEGAGLSVEEAARQAGIQSRREKFRAYYREPLRSWFFVREDRTAVGLRFRNNRWERLPLPRMDLTAPEQLCRLDHGATALLLRPETFGDLTEIRTPSLVAAYGDHPEPGGGIRYDPGATAVEEQKVWAILDRARQRSVDLRVVTIEPAGMGARRLLTAGVTVDDGGRWIEPKIDGRSIAAGEKRWIPESAARLLPPGLQGRAEWPGDGALTPVPASGDAARPGEARVTELRALAGRTLAPAFQPAEGEGGLAVDPAGRLFGRIGAAGGGCEGLMSAERIGPPGGLAFALRFRKPLPAADAVSLRQRLQEALAPAVAARLVNGGWHVHSSLKGPDEIAAEIALPRFGHLSCYATRDTLIGVVRTGP